MPDPTLRFFLRDQTAAVHGELGLSADHGARHLAAQTADKGRWPAFLDRLETPGLDREAAAAGANRTFAFALAAFRAEIGA